MKKGEALAYMYTASHGLQLVDFEEHTEGCYARVLTEKALARIIDIREHDGIVTGTTLLETTFDVELRSALLKAIRSHVDYAESAPNWFDRDRKYD